MRISSGRPDRLHDAVDDLLEVQVVGIDDHGVVGRFERRDGPLRVDPIPELDLSAHRRFVDSLGAPRHGLGVTRVDAALGSHPCDGPVHQSAIYKRKAELLGDALADRGFARRHPSVDRDDHGSSRPVARRSAATSPSDSTRQPPVLSRPSLSGPNAVRRRETTLWPMAWSMRRTSRFLPSRITMRISALPESRAPLVARSISTSAGAVMPSSSLTPSRSVLSCLEAGTPATTTSYSLATL